MVLLIQSALRAMVEDALGLSVPSEAHLKTVEVLSKLFAQLCVWQVVLLLTARPCSQGAGQVYYHSSIGVWESYEPDWQTEHG